VPFEPRAAQQRHGTTTTQRSDAKATTPSANAGSGTNGDRSELSRPRWRCTSPRHRASVTGLFVRLETPLQGEAAIRCATHRQSEPWIQHLFRRLPRNRTTRPRPPESSATPTDSYNVAIKSVDENGKTAASELHLYFQFGWPRCVMGDCRIFRHSQEQSARVDRRLHTMTASKRIFVVLSLANYLAAATAIHALHDHSAAGHCCHEQSCVAGAFDTEGGDCADASAESAHHGGHSSPTNCEDSCFACRFLAAKSLPPAITLPVDRFETVCQLEFLRLAFTPLTQTECSLCRGPPSAC
jgi:hypothetical protein